MLNEKVNGIYGKIFTKKNIPMIILISAIVYLVSNIIGIISSFESSFSGIIYPIARLIWSILTICVLIFGIIGNKDKLFKLGIFLLTPFLINSFISAFSIIGSINFKYSALFGLYILFYALTMLTVAVAFIIWILNNFAEIKVNVGIINILSALAILFIILALIFSIIYYASLSQICSFICIIAEIVIFSAEFNKSQLGNGESAE